MTEIIFTNTLGVPLDAVPQPASKMVPDWYKDSESYMGPEKKPDGNGMMNGTIKRCMPIFDAINAGYLLVTHTDIHVSQKKISYTDKEHFNKTGEDNPLTDEEVLAKGFPLTNAWFEWPSFAPIDFHPPEQAPLHPEVTGTPIPKWINPWSIKTPPGYSTLFVAPLHRTNVFNALPGVVDTDQYDAPVNIVFVLSDPKFEGTVPAGTPIVQVIPFKREVWSMRLGEEKDLENQTKTSIKLRTKFFDSYKSQYRQPKEYR
jgi:hypothetical protein